MFTRNVAVNLAKIFSVIILCPIAVFAQAGGMQSGTDIGLKGGVNFTKLSVEDGYHLRPGIDAGFFLSHGLSRKLSYQGEILCSVNRFKIDHAPSSVINGAEISKYQGQESVTLNFVDIVNMIKFKSDSSPDEYLYAGLSYSIFLFGQSSWEIDSSATKHQIKYDDFHTSWKISGTNINVDLNLIVGIAWNLNPNLSLDLRGSIGLNEIKNDSYNFPPSFRRRILTVSDDDAFRRSSVKLLLCYKL